MPRAPRIEYAGGLYHVMNRGNHYRGIFEDKLDVRTFLKTLGECCESFGWSVHAFALMGNHYHALIETHRATLSRGMQWLNSTYTLRYNSRHKLRGHLFQGRYKAIVVEGIPNYFQAAADYIHMNPVRAGRTRSVEELFKDEGNSAGWLTGIRRGRPEWLRWERVFGVYGMEKWTVKNRRRYWENLKRRVADVRGGKVEATGQYNERRWYWGSEAFAEGLKTRVTEWMGKVKSESWTGRAVEEAEEQRAERLLEELAKKMDLDQSEMVAGVERHMMARYVYEKSGVDSRWLSKRLGYRSAGTLRKQISNMQKMVENVRKMRRAWENISQISA